MIPEKDLINKTFTVREMRFPSEVSITKNSLLRWFALSIGLLSEDETRLAVIPVLDSFFELQLKEKTRPTIKDLAEKSGQPEKAVRYHINKLKELGFVDEEKRRYFFKIDSNSNELKLVKTFKEHYSQNVEKALQNSEKAIAEIQRMYDQG